MAERPREDGVIFYPSWLWNNLKTIWILYIMFTHSISYNSSKWNFPILWNLFGIKIQTLYQDPKGSDTCFSPQLWSPCLATWPHLCLRSLDTVSFQHHLLFALALAIGSLWKAILQNFMAFPKGKGRVFRKADIRSKPLEWSYRWISALEMLLEDKDILKSNSIDWSILGRIGFCRELLALAVIYKVDTQTLILTD